MFLCVCVRIAYLFQLCYCYHYWVHHLLLSQEKSIFKESKGLPYHNIIFFCYDSVSLPLFLVIFCLSGTINSEFADALYLIILSWLLSFCCPLWYAVNPHGVPTDNWRDCIPLHWESIAKRYWADILLAVERIFSDKFQTYPTIAMSIMQLSRMIIVNLNLY